MQVARVRSPALERGHAPLGDPPGGQVPPTSLRRPPREATRARSPPHRAQRRSTTSVRSRPASPASTGSPARVAPPRFERRSNRPQAHRRGEHPPAHRGEEGNTKIRGVKRRDRLPSEGRASVRGRRLDVQPSMSATLTPRILVLPEIEHSTRQRDPLSHMERGLSHANTNFCAREDLLRCERRR